VDEEGMEGEGGKKRVMPEGRVDGVRDLPYDLGMIVGFGDLWSYSYNHPKYKEERRDEHINREIRKIKSWTDRPT
jgi:hypothetical protein